MLFNSFEFVLLVAATLAVYYVPRLSKAQIPLLILASFVFYARSHLPLLLLLIASIAINIIASRLVAGTIRAADAGSDGAGIADATLRRRTRLYAATGVILNLVVLGFFKYSPLFGRTFFSSGDLAYNFLIAIPLPVGISFFTFQGISLVVDVFRSQTRAQYRDLVAPEAGRHILNTTLFIGFFPQLVAGPIVKAHDFLPQIKTKVFGDVDLEFCFRKLVLGYFLKLVIADNLKDQTFSIAYPYFETYGVVTLAALLIAYSVQIFADFAGYSLIAIGVAALFGYRLRENFEFPYISTSMSEFWRRWHISLSSFLKEYLYIPLGGNRISGSRTYINLFVTMVLGGLWHGAAWSYAVWGAFHGLALAIERLLRDVLPERWQPGDDWLPVRYLKMFAVFTIVTFGWLLFKLPEFEHAVLYLQALGTNQEQANNWPQIWWIAMYCFPVFAYHAYYLLRRNWTGPAGRFRRTYWEPVCFGVLLFLIIVNSGSADEFIYFQF